MKQFAILTTVIMLLVFNPSGFAAFDGKNLAVLDLKPLDVTVAQSEMISESIRSSIVTCWESNVVERKKMNLILSEEGFQLTDFCDQSSCAVKAGKLLAADMIVYGTLTKTEGAYNAIFFIVDVESGRYRQSFDINAKSISKLKDFIRYDICPEKVESYWNFSIGGSYICIDPNLPRDLVNHQVHPDDVNIPIPEPGGTTALDKVETVMLNLGIEYIMPRSRNFSWLVGYTIKIPGSTDGREEKQCPNDPRPPEQGSFVYTEIESMQPAHEIHGGVSYKVSSDKSTTVTISPRLALGYWEMQFEKGWDRFGADEISLKSDAKGFSFSPQIVLSAGSDFMNGSLLIAYRYMSLDYDYSELGSEVAQSWEAGLNIAFSFGRK